MIDVFSNEVENAITIVENSDYAYCHYITPTDVSRTGHQQGFYIPAFAYSMFFRGNKKKGENKKNVVKIKWQLSKTIENNIHYYGRKKDECRITNFGKTFEFIDDKYIGCLLIVTKKNGRGFNAYVLTSDDDIDDFIDYYRLEVSVKNQPIKGLFYDELSENVNSEIQLYANGFVDFPSTLEICNKAQDLIVKLRKYGDADIIKNCDNLILEWSKTDYRIFNMIEQHVYEPFLTTPFKELIRLVRVSKIITNRRKSRAGLSLEHHLNKIFSVSDLRYQLHAKTELKKTPDFLFPDESSYHNPDFNPDKLFILGAKTTCKDRWRQVLSEADRVKHKYLFTLQQGVSNSQLKEMTKANLTLVVPNKNLGLFTPDSDGQIINLKTFIKMIKEKQSL